MSGRAGLVDSEVVLMPPVSRDSDENESGDRPRCAPYLAEATTAIAAASARLRTPSLPNMLLT